MIGWMARSPFPQPLACDFSCESQDLTCQTASDQIAFCMKAGEFRVCHSGMVALSAWVRWAVKPYSRVAVRRRHRA
jgi:hypothetical protein